MLKRTLIEFIAEMDCTAVQNVTQDIESQQRSNIALDQFCEAMEDAGY
ncbi:hypothetical protein [Edaphobacter dinghuensis]|uniref:Uncharacterized protein n=1 Tax=Edaphobacter dinghuensis TaxID=1560005 RepID=A0A917HRI2_9BACT|nr:hypothetical protein [Edaphobacter dinghuensis]GGG86756.1 hypothetical protein GCM10011585_33390 [Edaphobacter dinghuensis]